jgi:hypothetical protein
LKFLPRPFSLVFLVLVTLVSGASASFAAGCTKSALATSITAALPTQVQGFVTPLGLRNNLIADFNCTATLDDVNTFSQPPLVPTLAPGTNTQQAASTAFVINQIAATGATLIPGVSVISPKTNGGVLFDNNGVLGDSTTLPIGALASVTAPSINFRSSGNSNNYDEQLQGSGGIGVNGGGTLFLAGTFEIVPVAASVQAGLLIAQSGPASGSAINGNVFYNRINITSDQANVGSGCAGGCVSDALRLDYSFGGSNTIGARQVLDVEGFLTAATSNGANANHNWVGANLQMNATVTDGGTGLTNVTALGAFFGSAPTVQAYSGATNLFQVNGEQVSVSQDSGATTFGRFGIQVSVVALAHSNGLGHGQGDEDAAFMATNGTGPSWQNGLTFDAVWAAAPILTTGTAIKVVGAQTMARFIDASALSCSQFFIIGPSFQLNCSGSLIASSVTAGASFALAGSSTGLTTFTSANASATNFSISVPSANGTLALTSGANVASVSNSDGTLTISPTTGTVVASITLSHANTWSNQTIAFSTNTLTGVAPTANPTFTGTLTGAAANWSGVQTINLSGSALPSPPAGTILQIGNVVGTQTRVTSDSFANGSNIIFRRADGTVASPTALQTGDVVGQFSWFGYGATGYSTSASALIAGFAAQNWTDTAQGAYFAFRTTAIGSAVSSEMARFQPTGGVSIGNSTFNATDPGAGFLAVQGGVSFGAFLASTGAAPTCGTGCASVTGSSTKFAVTAGTAVTSITVNFAASYYASAPVCTIGSGSTASVVDVATVTASAITLGASVALTGGVTQVICVQ